MLTQQITAGIAVTATLKLFGSQTTTDSNDIPMFYKARHRGRGNKSCNEKWRISSIS